MEGLTWEASKEKNWLVVKAQGSLNRLTSSEAGKAFEEYLSQTDKLALSFKDLNYLSSAGIRVILRLEQSAGAAGKDFALISPTGMVREMLEDAGLDVLLRIYAGLEELP